VTYELPSTNKGLLSLRCGKQHGLLIQKIGIKLSKIDKLTDKKCLEQFLEYLKERVKVGTAYIQDPETKFLTHQMLVFQCGDLETATAPDQLTSPFKIVGGEELGVAVN
jgi:hypothetical protein